MSETMLLALSMSATSLLAKVNFKGKSGATLHVFRKQLFRLMEYQEEATEVTG